jgi:flagellar biosynthesis/type III secretory pathway protein FliH
MVHLVRAIAKRVLTRELSQDPSVVQRLVHEGLLALAANDTVSIRIGSFFAEVREQIEVAAARSGIAVQVIIDPTVGIYGCRIETQWGSVDESVDARLATLLEAISIAPPRNNDAE